MTKVRNLIRSRFQYGFATLLFAMMLFASPANAQLSFQLRTGNSATNTQSMIIDSNKCPNDGPTAMFVGGVITNTGARANDVVATISGLNANIYLAGGQPAAQDIGTLDPGASIAVYWFTGYSCNELATATPQITLSSSAGTQVSTLVLTIRKAISANAGGNVISSVLGPGAVVGQTIAFDTQYDFGGTAAGDEYFLQPSGGQNFDAACFRLMKTEVTGSNLNAVTVGAVDRLYFVQPNRQPGNNYFINVRYSFQYMCGGASTTARPYAAQTSGNTNIKYTGNFDGAGSIAINFPGATNPFTISKTVSETNAFVGKSGDLIYTITISNPSAFASEIGRFVDQLPSDMTFQGLTALSDVTAGNSSSIPVTGATGILTFRGKRGQSYAIAAGGSVTLQYRASRPTNAGTYVNSAQAYFGNATTPVAQATYQQSEVVPLSVTKVSSVVSDPVRGTADPHTIPGALIEYAIVVTNPNDAAVDSDSVIVSDLTPENTKMCVTDIAANGSGPVGFSDGPTSSQLSFSFIELAAANDDLEFSNDDGASWTYVPSPDVEGCDASIDAFRINPKGMFAARGNFTINVRYRIN
ncbi:hypothetical protein [Sphingomicrobium marinum]|uniref:hypothetical protein n=1 Tax=Sphingomicrobium marinum TaxID=1227950 RepID=UPI00224079D2|nr:hypothetical protein [Sphingomicrobium marinum]